MQAQTQEQQLGVTAKIFDYPNTFNLYWMDSRLVVVNTKHQSVFGIGLIPTLIGEVVTKISEKSKENKNKELTLDEILAKDKTSFAVPYADIAELSMFVSPSRWKNSKLTIRTTKAKKEFILEKKHIEQLKGILPIVQQKIKWD